MGRNTKHQNRAIEKYGSETADAEEILESESFRKHNMRLFRERVISVTKNELARRIGVTPQSICDWESLNKPDAAPNEENLQKLCNEFGCKPVDLYSDFRVKYLGSMVDDMLEVILADFNVNIRSRSVSNKKLAMEQYKILADARIYQESRGIKDERDPDSVNKEAEMHRRRYGTPEDPEDPENTEQNEEDE